MSTFAELEQKRQAGGLTPAEKKQWEILFNQDEYAVEQIFRTPVGGKVAIPNEANRRIIWQWAQGEMEPIADIRVWFANIFRENPSLARQLAWQDAKALDPAYQAELAKKNENELRARFLEVCKTHDLAENNANFTIWSNSGPDPVVSWFNSKPVIVLESGETLDLVPATQEQKDQWRQEFEKRKFDQNQEHLKDLVARNDIAGLRKAAAAEYAEKHRQTVVTAREQKIHRELQIQYERDTQAGFRDPLPAVFTKQKIYTWDANEMRRQMKRYGASRITARIHGLTEIPDGNGGVIKFEQGEQQ